MSHSYITYRQHFVRLEDEVFIIAGYFLCRALKELSATREYRTCLLAENLSVLENGFVYNGPGAMLVALDVFVDDLESNKLLNEAAKLAVEGIKRFGSFIPRDFLNSNVRGPIVFGNHETEPLTKAFSKITQELLKRGRPSGQSATSDQAGGL